MLSIVEVVVDDEESILRHVRLAVMKVIASQAGGVPPIAIAVPDAEGRAVLWEPTGEVRLATAADLPRDDFL